MALFFPTSASCVVLWLCFNLVLIWTVSFPGLISLSSVWEAPLPPDPMNGGHKEGPHMCPTCGKVYKWKITLNRHMRLECGQERQFPCELCCMRFKRKSHMERHKMLRHAQGSGNKDFQVFQTL